MRKVVVVLWFQLLALYVIAGGEGNASGGARSAGMGGVTVALFDVGSIGVNPSLLGRFEKNNASLQYRNHYFLPDAGFQRLAVNYDFENSGLGVNISSFGNKLYRENRAGMAYGMKLSDRFSAGLVFSLLNTKLSDNYGQSYAVSAGAGLSAELGDALLLGMSVENINRAVICADEAYPVKMRLGLNGLLSEKVSMCAELEKSLKRKPLLRFGLEYQPHELLFFRFGVVSSRLQSSFGLGLESGAFRLDLSSSFHPVLGLSTGIAFSCSIK